MINIAIFASGTGTNTRKILEHFKSSDIAAIKLIVSNKSTAKVLQIAKEWGVDILLIEKERFSNEDCYLTDLQKSNIDFIVLAGFLWKVPTGLINAFPKKIINIHPALLPKYGGKNMYGTSVHKAVIESGDKVSGITIHYVDEHYDHGDVIFQAKYKITPGESASSLAENIHSLEYKHFPEIIEKVIKRTFNIEP